MIPFGAEVRIMATRARLGHRLGEDVIVVEVDAHTVPDFSLALTPSQARDLANQLAHPIRRADGPAIAPARWLRGLVRRRA